MIDHERIKTACHMQLLLRDAGGFPFGKNRLWPDRRFCNKGDRMITCPLLLAAAACDAHFQNDFDVGAGNESQPASLCCGHPNASATGST